MIIPLADGNKANSGSIPAISGSNIDNERLDLEARGMENKEKSFQEISATDLRKQVTR